MVEVLKQGQYVPMNVEKQISIIFAASKGFLDKIDVEKVSEYENNLFDYLDANNSNDLKSIIDEGLISEKTEKNIEKSISDFTKGFLAK